jgi:predicted NAD-dependent protein-ADP-ribosyltransferase YbiA (DUF1768 family)
MASNEAKQQRVMAPTELGDWVSKAWSEEKPATLVCVKKNNEGKWDRDFDVLLDEKSEWAPPVWQTSNRAREYEDHILCSPKLREALPTLLGQTVACLCPSHKGFCFAEVLVKLVNRLLEYRPVVRTADCIFFKGFDFILSSFHDTRLIDYCLGHRHEFKSAMQLFVVLYFCELCEWERAEKAAHSSSFTAYKIWRSYLHSDEDNKRCYTYPQIRMMYYVLEKKWSVSREFRNYLQAFVDEFYFAEATQNKFWSCGLELSEVIPHTTNIELTPGRNLLGWLLRYVTLKKTDRELQWQDEVNELFQNRDATQIPFTNFEKGMILVDRALQQQQTA